MSLFLYFSYIQFKFKQFTSKFRELLRWWGHYFESLGNIESSINCYKQAGDNLSLCRVYCYSDHMKEAIELCNETNDTTACYHLASQFERKKNFKEAINYYQRAGAVSNAIRICKVISLRLKRVFFPF
jgi:tetratricopeptide (TPR) repeat protein